MSKKILLIFAFMLVLSVSVLGVAPQIYTHCENYLPAGGEDPVEGCKLWGLEHARGDGQRDGCFWNPNENKCYSCQQITCGWVGAKSEWSAEERVQTCENVANSCGYGNIASIGMYPYNCEAVENADDYFDAIFENEGIELSENGVNTFAQWIYERTPHNDIANEEASFKRADWQGNARASIIANVINLKQIEIISPSPIDSPYGGTGEYSYQGISDYTAFLPTLENEEPANEGYCVYKNWIDNETIGQWIIEAYDVFFAQAPNQALIIENSTTCETGSNAYSKYGFDKLLFDWRWEGIGNISCDELGGTKFCDASQFSISLAKKGNAIKEFADQYKAQFNEDSLFSGVSGFENINDFKNTENLYRWIIKQAKVTDNTTWKLHLFFISPADEPLFVQDINAWNSPYPNISDAVNKMGNVLEDVNAVIESANDGNEFVFGTEDVLGVVNDSSLDSAKLAAIGFDGNYITYNEYKALYEKLDATLGVSCQSYDTSCTITGVNSGNVEITTEFLLKMHQNLMFYVAVRDVSNLNMQNNGNLIRRIMSDAKYTIGYENPYELWLGNVDFDSYILKDDFGGNGIYTKEKFINSYKNNDNGELDAVDFANWELPVSMNNSAGKHLLLLNYGWMTDSFELKNFGNVALQDLGDAGQEYKNNFFFYKPFNAGLASGSQDIVLSHYDTAEYAAMPPSIGNLTFEDNFDSAKDGLVLDISENNITYAPTSAVKITLEVSSEPSGVFYEMDPEAGSDYLIEWNGIADHKESGTNIQRICSNITTDNYGITGSISENMQAVVYAPVNVPTSLRMLCSGEQHNLLSQEFDADLSDNIDAKTDTATVSNNITGEEALLELNNTGMVNYYSIEKYVELIAEGKICVENANSDSLKLRWNENAFYESAAAEPPNLQNGQGGTSTVEVMRFDPPKIEDSSPASCVTIKSPGVSGNVINLIFVEEGYWHNDGSGNRPNMKDFITDVQDISDELFNVTPFYKYKDYFAVYAVKFAPSMGCTVPINDRFVNCNDVAIYGAVLQCGKGQYRLDGRAAPYILISSKDKWAGSGRYGAVGASTTENSYENNAQSLSATISNIGGLGVVIPQWIIESLAKNISGRMNRISLVGIGTVIHELGHTIGYLKDEYVYASNEQAGRRERGTGENCAQTSAECDTKWNGTTHACFQGCSLPDWYRSSSNSIMRDHSSIIDPTFNDYISSLNPPYLNVTQAANRGPPWSTIYVGPVFNYVSRNALEEKFKERLK